MEGESTMTLLYQAWLVGMVVLFLGIVWWAYRPKNRDMWEKRGRIPLNDEEG